MNASFKQAEHPSADPNTTPPAFIPKMIINAKSKCFFNSPPSIHKTNQNYHLNPTAAIIGTVAIVVVLLAVLMLANKSQNRMKSKPKLNQNNWMDNGFDTIELV